MRPAVRFAVFALLTAAPMAQTVTNLWPGTTGAFTQRALDIVILGDGYTAAQQALFNANAAQLASRLSAIPGGSLPGTVPFGQYRFEYRIWSVFAASQQTGVDLPTGTVNVAGVPLAAQTRDTRYNCAYFGAAPPRAVLPINGGANGPVHSTAGLNTAVADANLITPLVPAQVANAPSRVFIVLVNQPNVYGGAAQFASTGVSYCAAFNGTATSAPATPVGLQVQIHELGHAMGVLFDEYNDEDGIAGNAPYVGPGIPFGVNVTTTSASPSWALWVPTIGAPRLGGLNFDSGIWHPQQNCLMNRLYLNGNLNPFLPATTLGATNAFCSVCTEQIVKQISVSADPYTFYTPPTATPLSVAQGQSQLFSLSSLVASAFFQWRVNGVVVASGPSPSLNLNTAGYGIGSTLTVDCVLTDQTPLVQNPPGGVVSLPSNAWTVNVIAPTPDLAVVPNSIASVSTIDAGSSTFTMGGTITNTGTAAAGQTFAIEYFLCASPTAINLNTDVLVCRDFAIGGLAVNAFYSTNTNGSVPFYTPNGTWFLGAWIDRLGAAGDPNPGNNVLVSSSPVAVTPVLGCPTVLEIAQPVPNLTGGGISAAAGASLSLVNTAPCLVGDTYIVAISVTGDTPGTPVGAFVLPLVFDAATQTGLNLINTPPFLAFLGTIGANGQGVANFAPAPAQLSPGQFKMWFATTFLNNGSVTGVTNSVGIRVNP